MIALNIRISRLADSLILTVFILLCDNSSAHDINVTGVGRVFLDETSLGHYSLSIVDQIAPPPPNSRVVPARCSELEARSYAYHFSCQPGLNLIDEINLPWQLEGIVVIARWQGGEETSGYFPSDGYQITVPMSELSAASSSILNLSKRYLLLGIDHILFGLDHLLFVLGMLLLINGPLKLVQTVTSFTVAHSLTLASAVLGIAYFPSAPIELLIAVSIVFLARESLLKDRTKTTLTQKSPWIVAFVFGLLHGFGFAGALGDLGLRDSDIPPALLFFNIGVEIGQLLFISASLGLYWIIKQVSPALAQNSPRGLAYGLGIIATFWVFERAPALFHTV